MCCNFSKAVKCQWHSQRWAWQNPGPPKCLPLRLKKSGYSNRTVSYSNKAVRRPDVVSCQLTESGYTTLSAILQTTLATYLYLSEECDKTIFLRLLS